MAVLTRCCRRLWSRTYCLVVKSVDTHLVQVLDHHLVDDSVMANKRLSVPCHMVALRTLVDETFLIGNPVAHPVLEVRVTEMPHKQLPALESSLAQGTSLPHPSHLELVQD